MCLYILCILYIYVLVYRIIIIYGVRDVQYNNNIVDWTKNTKYIGIDVYLYLIM